MKVKRATQTRTRFSSRLVSELYAISRAEEYGLSQPELVAILEQVADKHFAGAAVSPAEAGNFLRSLHLEELALARACAAGHQRAWDFFLTRYREGLYGAAYSIAREESAARDLADSIYADLYGTRTRDGERLSKLASYTGRGSLAGWLRTVMAQQHVDRYRKVRRMVSLDEESEKGVQFVAHAPQPDDSLQSHQHSRLEQATDDALAQLLSEERFILASYFLDGRTLAEIARMLGVHESTISRKIDKLTTGLRKRIRDALAKGGLTRPQAEELLESDVRDLAIDVKRSLGRSGSDSVQEKHSPTFSIKEKIAPEGPNLKEL